MGRTKLPDKKVHVGCRVRPDVKKALDSIAISGKWKPAQVLEIVVLESPRVKAAMRNGQK